MLCKCRECPVSRPDGAMELDKAVASGFRKEDAIASGLLHSALALGGPHLRRISTSMQLMLTEWLLYDFLEGGVVSSGELRSL